MTPAQHAGQGRSHGAVAHELPDFGALETGRRRLGGHGLLLAGQRFVLGPGAVHVVAAHGALVQEFLQAVQAGLGLGLARAQGLGLQPGLTGRGAHALFALAQLRVVDAQDGLSRLQGVAFPGQDLDHGAAQLAGQGHAVARLDLAGEADALPGRGRRQAQGLGRDGARFGLFRGFLAAGGQKQEDGQKQGDAEGWTHDGLPGVKVCLVIRIPADPWNSTSGRRECYVDRDCPK
ncbi:hypothetical protein DSECCO2_482100 [anaerobic digester metagenome]